MGALQGLLRAQHTYMLPTIEVARGKLKDRQTLARLSADDCAEIASHCLSGNQPFWKTFEFPQYALAIEWLEFKKNEYVKVLSIFAKFYFDGIPTCL